MVIWVITVIEPRAAAPFLFAENMPMGIEKMTIIKKASSESSAVFGRRLARSEFTVVPLYMSDSPKSPVTAPFIQLKYWTMTGSLRPISSRRASICSAVAFVPSFVAAASPGITENAIKTTREVRRREIIKVIIFFI